jgi:DNA ligase-1
MLFQIEPKTLYKKAADGSIRLWTISIDDDELVIHHGIKNGVLQEKREEILIGKGGRSVYQQKLSRFNSRINKQLLKGYKETLEEAVNNKSNAMGLVQPMLATPIDKVKKINYDGAHVQYKYDGNRCLITKQGSEIIAYSRRGKLITSIEHITSKLDIPDGVTLDGELYIHGKKLQNIRSLIARKQSESISLRYHVYDIIRESTYSERLRELLSLKLPYSVEVVPTIKLNEPDQLDNMRHAAIKEGYEGLILRLEGTGYEADKRSKSLLKLKEFQDDEFEVINIYMSDKYVPMATCLAKNNKTFDVVLPGSFNEKEIAYRSRSFYLQQLLTIEYSQLTADGIPFHGIAKAWRKNNE